MVWIGRLFRDFPSDACLFLAKRSSGDSPFLNRFACSRLKTLRLKGCKNLGDASLQRIVDQNWSTLESLNILGCVRFTEEALDILSRCSNLRSLSLQRPGEATHEKMLPVIRGCPSLRKLKIHRFKCDGNELLASISQHLTQLMKLSINRVRVGEAALQGLFASCPSLEALTLSEAEIVRETGETTDVDGSQAFARASRVKLTGKVSSIRFLNAATSLQSLAIGSNKFRDQEALSFRPPSSLRSLSLEGCIHLTDDSVPLMVSRASFLTSLVLMGLFHVSAIVNPRLPSTLRHLSLSGLHLGPAPPPFVLPHLEHLDISSTRLPSNDCVQLLQSCSTLRTLVLSQSSNLTDAALPILATRLVHLKRLHLNKARQFSLHFYCPCLLYLCSYPLNCPVTLF